MEKVIKIFTDGSCIGNPGKGGWAALIKVDNKEITLSGNELETTNNRMELTAAIEALKYFKKNTDMCIYTDSNYLKNGITSWIKSWKNNNWKTSARKPVKNIDLWQSLDNLVIGHNIQWFWVKAHAGHIENEIVDKMAREEAING